MDTVKNRKSGKIKPKTTKVEAEEKYVEKLIENGKLERQEGDGESTSDITEDKQICKEEKTNNLRNLEYSTAGKICRISCEVDLISICLFLCALLTRMYKLQEPKNIV